MPFTEKEVFIFFMFDFCIEKCQKNGHQLWTERAGVSFIFVRFVFFHFFLPTGMEIILYHKYKIRLLLIFPIIILNPRG